MSAPNPQNSRQQWEEVYHNLASNQPGFQRDFPQMPPKITPLVNKPQCDDHCTRHEVDRPILCGTCGAHAYNVVAHQWPWSDGHYWHSVEPVNGARPYNKVCPNCEGTI